MQHAYSKRGHCSRKVDGEAYIWHVDTKKPDVKDKITKALQRKGLALYGPLPSISAIKAARARGIARNGR